MQPDTPTEARPFGAMTLAERLVVTHNRPSGFDWMRLTLATSIVLWHTVVTSYGGDFQNSIWATPHWRVPLAALLGMFFSLSGFLVAGSLERCRTIVSFGGLRVMRIFPALVVEVALSAIILGPIYTNLPLREYFSAPEFRHYFGNMLGNVHYVLPGVFLDNPLPKIVNG